MTAVRLRVIAPERPDARIEAVQAAVIDEARRLGVDDSLCDIVLCANLTISRITDFK